MASLWQQLKKEPLVYLAMLVLVLSVLGGILWCMDIFLESSRQMHSLPPAVR